MSSRQPTMQAPSTSTARTLSASSCCCPLPGRTRAQALEAFLTPLRRSLSCATAAQLLVSPSKRAGVESEALTLSQDPLQLRSDHLGDRVQLRLRHQFRAPS